jgi:hypothetical protein
MAISRAENVNARNCAEGSNILSGLVRGSEMGVHEASSVPNENYRQVVVSHINLDLLEDANGYEGAEAIDKRTEALACKTRSHANHVLFCDASIYELSRQLSSKFVKKRVAVISGQKHYSRITSGNLDQRF